MIVTVFSFLSILMIFVRAYSISSLFYPSKEKNKFSERIIIFTLIFEIMTTLFFVFFSSFKYLLTPVLLFFKNRQFQYFIFENLSTVLIIYVIIDFFLLSTFYPLNPVIKFSNRAVLLFVFTVNILLGIMTFLI